MCFLDDVAKVLIPEDVLRARVRDLAGQINQTYTQEDFPLLVCILKGAFVFLADLIRHLNFRHEVDFMVISSYGSGTVSSGVVRILLDLERSIEGRHVLIVEDIIDTGRTMSYIIRNLQTRHPASLRVCTLLSKPSRREIEIPLDFVGFEIPDEFVVGYGLDFAEAYRNLPFIGVLKPEVIGMAP
ncbi:MAG: hypoxanthine phosphoribosyltransferase [Anaerolineae bacterium]|nr:hypoxanthine phosphoribosyltransferase [Anaerolineae bacterium]MDW8068222.1 hypoxanthine phosphoribosyltransferase [Anaerolineae bacterium]